MNPWTKRGLVVGAVLAALAGAYGAGRFAAPTKVVTKTEVVTKEVIKEVKAETKVIYRDRVVDRVITKDGTVTEHIVYKSAEATKEVDRTSDAKSSDTKTEKVTITDAPRLTVSVLAGVDLKPAWQPLGPSAGPLALGLSVQYRVAGPIVVGAWGLHTGAFGASLGIQF